jgi:hypothetical protein
MAKSSLNSLTLEPKVRLFRPHPAQKQILECDARFIVIVAGRRTGKTSFIPTLRARSFVSGQQGAYLSPTYKMLSEYFRIIRYQFAPIITKINKQEHRIEFVNGGSLTMWSLDNADSIRGQKYHYADIDEAAMVRDLSDAWNAVIRPTLTDFQGRAAFWSTPKGAGTFFHSLYQRGLTEDHPDWQSFQFPTASNPFINPAEIESARLELPQEVFRQEYLAEFVAGEGAVFRNITANLTAPDTVPADHKGHTLVAGVDWGQVNDFTAISIICTDCKQEVFLDRFNKIDWEFQRARLMQAINTWEVTFTLVEENSIGSPNLEALQKSTSRQVKGFLTTAQSKSPLIQSLALCFEQMEIRWFNVGVATAELEAYEAVRNETTNRITYSAPKGGHDDTVIARALAREAMEQRKKGQWNFQTFRF